MIPVHIRYPGTLPPTRTPHYILARNGLFMRVDNDWIDATVPMKELQVLEPETPKAELKLPPIADNVFSRAVAFFHQVFEERGTEAVVLLHYSKEKGWELSVPRQMVTFGSVKYDMNERLDGYRCVGTMHSHGNMSAFHSSTDVDDEAEFDGVHITIGSLRHYPLFSMAAEVVCRGQRFPLETRFIAGVVEVPREDLSVLLQQGGQSPYRRNYLCIWGSGEIYRRYRLDCEVPQGWEVPGDWLEKVKVTTFISRFEDKFLGRPTGRDEPYRDDEPYGDGEGWKP